PPSHPPLPYTTLFRSRAKPRDRHEHAERDDDSQSTDAGGHECDEVPPRLFERFADHTRSRVPHDGKGFVDGDRERAERRMRAKRSEEHTSELQSRGHL